MTTLKLSKDADLDDNFDPEDLDEENDQYCTMEEGVLCHGCGDCEKFNE